MIDLKRGEAKFVLGCVGAFAAEFERGVVAVLAGELRGVEPREVREVREQLHLLQRQLESRQHSVKVHATMAGLERDREGARLDRRRGGTVAAHLARSGQRRADRRTTLA